MAADPQIALTALLDRLPAANVTGDAHAARHRHRNRFAFRVARARSSWRCAAVAPTAISTPRKRLQRGASAVVVEESAQVAEPARAAVIRVADSKRALSVLSAAFYGDPSRRLDVIGVTGTNGKTTTHCNGCGDSQCSRDTVRRHRHRWRRAGFAALATGQHDAAAARTACAAGGHAGRRRASGGRRGQFARIGARARRRRYLPGSGAHQRHARSSRLSRIAGALTPLRSAIFSS